MSEKQNLTINHIMINALMTAEKRGKYKQVYTPEHYHALIHAEIGEATNEARLQMPPIYQECPHGQDGHCYVDCDCDMLNAECWIKPDSKKWSPDKKPQGELIELADALILICSYAAKNNMDLEKAIELKMKYDKTRSC